MSLVAFELLRVPDRYQRTPDGWRFAERVDEIKYLDTTPLAGSPPDAAARSERE